MFREWLIDHCLYKLLNCLSKLRIFFTCVCEVKWQQIHVRETVFISCVARVARNLQRKICIKNIYIFWYISTECVRLLVEENIGSQNAVVEDKWQSRKRNMNVILNSKSSTKFRRTLERKLWMKTIIIKLFKKSTTDQGK